MGRSLTGKFKATRVGREELKHLKTCTTVSYLEHIVCKLKEAKRLHCTQRVRKERLTTGVWRYCDYRCTSFCFTLFVCISFMADGPQRTRLPKSPVSIAMLPSCLWSRRMFPTFPCSHLRFFIAMHFQHAFDTFNIL